MTRAVPAAAVTLIKHYEGFGFKPYLCPSGVWTIGWGHALRRDGQPLRGLEMRDEAEAMYPLGVSEDEALALLAADIGKAARGVESVVTVDLTDGQFGALVSFVFNLGLSRLRLSTLLRLLNAGDVQGAANQFLRWVHAGKPPRVLEGLVQRRHAERELFLS